MFKSIRNKKGFTLVELMIVAVIVAVLAAVAIPLMRGTTDRAMATESEAALGSIRSAMRAIYAETGDYSKAGTIVINDIIIGTTGAGTSQIPAFHPRKGTVTAGDLDGTYFSEKCYAIDSFPSEDVNGNKTDFVASCTWSKSVVSTFVPKAGDVKTKTIGGGTTSYSATIDSYGNIKRYGY